MTEVHVFEIADVFFTILKYVSYKDAISKITRICKSCYKMMHDDRAYQLLTLAINPIAQLPNGGISQTFTINYSRKLALRISKIASFPFKIWAS